MHVSVLAAVLRAAEAVWSRVSAGPDSLYASQWTGVQTQDAIKVESEHSGLSINHISACRGDW